MSFRRVLQVGGAAASASSSSWASPVLKQQAFCSFGVAVQRRLAGTSTSSKPTKFELETPELASGEQTVEELRNLEGSRLNWKTEEGKEKEARESEEGSPKERGGPKGPEPTRYTDWEVGGRVSDF